MTLQQKTDEFINHGDNQRDCLNILEECIEDASGEALSCVRRLFEADYGGITFAIELKAPAAWALACWQENGLDHLVEATLHSPTLKNVSLCTQVLGTIASNFSDSSAPLLCTESLRDSLVSICESNPTLPSYARRKLLSLILTFDDDQRLIDLMTNSFTFAASQGTGPAKELVSALSARWLAISQPILDNYEHLLVYHPDDETIYQEFFTRHPQILDPLATEVWPHPNLFGAKKPDFVVRRFDNSYLIVEIETPSKLLVTKGNYLAAPATAAMSQATDYRHYIRKHPHIQSHFPKIDGISCLAVVGLERGLNPTQAQALRNENSERNLLRVVGFDWLANRARSVHENVIRNGVRVRPIRIS